MIASIALKALGALLLVGVWIGEGTAEIPAEAKAALLLVGVTIGYAAVRAEGGRRSDGG